MSTPTVTLTGWKAVAVLVLVAGFVGFRWMTARDALNTEGRDYLEEWIALELQRPILADTTRALEERGEAVLAAANVQIRAMSGHGSLDDLVVKVELEPSADLPAGTELVRYYRMEYSSITGWTHRGDATALSYYLSIF
jgi:hypothetical protein